MQTGQLWDIFCTVIDNHGDLGVCWRLTRQLRDAGQRVRLWVDDASALVWMAPNAAQEPGIEVKAWAQASDSATLAALPPADVWIEAFGCNLPEAFVSHFVSHFVAHFTAHFVANTAASHRQQPVWINLEYLSAESWVPSHHGLPSPVMSGPAQGWTKRYFYPGFTPDTGGLLREADLLQRQQAFNASDRAAWRQRHAPLLPPGGRLISLFGYEPVALPQLLVQMLNTPDHLLATPGRPLAAVERALAAIPDHGPHPSWSALPYTDQNGFDEMLWACDLNLVRGEDSWVRALWAGQPFVWHIYPQSDNAHHAKLKAFLDWMQAPPSLRQFHRVWNGIEAGPLPALTDETLLVWAASVQAARRQLMAQKPLHRQLMLCAGCV